jgi:hypothetical protein
MTLVERLLREAPLQPSVMDGSVAPISEQPGTHDQVIQLMEMAQTLDKREILLKTQILNIISHAFRTTPSIRNSFRSLGGYVTLISVLVSLENVYNEIGSADGLTTSEGVPIEKTSVDRLIEVVLDVLRQSMTGLRANSRYFAKNIGYGSLENAIRMTGILQDHGSPHKLFSILIAFATEHDVFRNIFVPSDTKNDKPTDTSSNAAESSSDSIDKRLKSASLRISNADMLLSVLNLQKDIGTNHELSMQIFTAILALSCGNRHNQILLSRNGTMLHLLERLYPKPSTIDLSDVFEEHALTETERQLLMRLLQRLVAIGMPYAELRYLFETFEDQSSNAISLAQNNRVSLLDILQCSIENSRWPNFIHLDLSTGSNSAISLDHTSAFPPASGYTLLFWIHIEKQTNVSKLDILSVIQNGENKLIITIDGQTQHLQVEIQGRKQLMGFNTFQFQPGYWYHIALVHNRSRLGLTSSTMALYVNGSFLEQIRCPYSLSSGSPPSRLVFGNLATDKLTDEKRNTVWDLGPCYILEDVLDSDIVNLFFNIGARYTALFQDSLKQFQSYETSTALFLKLRTLSKASSKGDSSHSAFLEAMRGIGSTILPENKIVVALFAANTISDDIQGRIYPCNEGIQRFFASHNLIGDVTLNAAIPKINRALQVKGGLAQLMGSPLVVRPASVDDVLWKIGGFATVLKLVEIAEVKCIKN